MPFSRAWNFRFAEVMQAKLPRELRDMVYACLWDEHSLTCRYSGSPIRLVAGGIVDVDETDIMNMCDDSIMPHFLCSGYVERATASESVHALYNASHGHDAVRASTQNLHDALFEDRFHVVLQPSTIMREVSIYCKLDPYRTPPLHHKLSKDCHHSGSETLYIDQARLKANLKVLDIIKDKKNFRLEILLLQRNFRPSVLAQSLEAFRDVRKTFIEQGAVVQIIWSYDTKGTPLYGDCHFEIFTRIDDYFDMSQARWAKRFKKFVMAVRNLGAHIGWQLY